MSNGSRYLDIDTILCEEERLPVTFKIRAPHLAHLDSTISNMDGDDTLPEGSRTELPLWLALSLSTQNMVKLELPKHFGNKMRDEIFAGAGAINLREYSHYYYNVGILLSKATKDDDLLRILRRAFSGDRFKALMVNSLTNYNDDVLEYCQSLTSLEINIFNEGLLSARDVIRWRCGRSSVLQKASILKRSFVGSAGAGGNGSGGGGNRGNEDSKRSRI